MEQFFIYFSVNPYCTDLHYVKGSKYRLFAFKNNRSHSSVIGYYKDDGTLKFN